MECFVHACYEKRWMLTLIASRPCERVFLACSLRIMNGRPYYKKDLANAVLKYAWIYFVCSIHSLMLSHCSSLSFEIRRIDWRKRVTVTQGVTLPTEHGSQAWTLDLDSSIRYFTRNPHHGTRSRRMDSAARPMQATNGGRRKKAVRQGAQLISVLSITARL
jgi:hypothetical protein